MLTNPKPAGWTDDVDTITGQQISSIATQLVNALDAIGGGTYAPVADIIISPGGGIWRFGCNVSFASTSIVLMSGPFTCAGTAAFTSTVTCSSTLAVTGAVTCSSTLAVTGASTFTGAVTCSAALTASSTLTCTGLATFNGNAVFNGQATFNGFHTCASQAFFTSAVTFSGTNTVTGGPNITFDLSGVTKLTGRQVEAFPVYLTTTDVTLDHATGGNEIIMLAAPSANRIITLRQGTAPIPENGDWFEITVLLGTSAFTVAIQREGASLGDYVAVLGDGIGGTGNQVASAKVKLVAGVWRLMHVGGRYAFSGTDS